MRPPGNRPWIIAHRGASAAAAENTLAAFELARDLGADAVELDARRTADGAVVVHHDDTVSGMVIAEMPLADVRECCPEVPTLQEALDACRGMWVNVEVKNSPADHDWDPDDRSLPKVLSIVERSGIDVELSSFNPLTIARARALLPGMPTGWLFEPGMVAAEDAIDMAAAAGHDAIHPHHSLLAGDGAAMVVAAARAAGLWVITWTVDQSDEIRRLAAAGVDGIITNTPDAALAALG